MADINLLQNQLRDTTAIAQKRSSVAVFLVSAVFVLLLLAGGALYFFTFQLDSQLQETEASNENLSRQVNSAQNELGDAKAFQAKLSNAELLLKNHVYFTPLFEELEKNTYNKAMYLSMDVGPDTNIIHLQGTVLNYNDLGKLILGLSTSSQFQAVKLLGVTLSAGLSNGYVFSLDLIPSQDIFTK